MGPEERAMYRAEFGAHTDTSSPLETGAPSCVNRTGCETPNDCREHKYCRSPHNKTSPAATPRTDDAIIRFVKRTYTGACVCVDAEDMRTLERENAELRGKLEEAQPMFDLIETNKRLLGKVQAAESALATARASERERCAEVADGYNYGPCGQYDYGYTDASAKADERASQIADDIRALKEEA